jgi:ribosomal protein S3AE
VIGILEVLFGTTSIGTVDAYNVDTLYNQIWEITFTLTQDTTADLRFRVNGKNVAGTDYYSTFSRFQIDKTG